MKFHDPDKLEQHIKDGLVFFQKHPALELMIYNYTPKVQYESLWDDVTLKTRGLILDQDYEVIARPFEKFFNYEELSYGQIPWGLKFEATQKLDGSLGILFSYGAWNLASRGSFNSEQAKKGQMIIHKKYAKNLKNLDPNYTYLFEIIYPSNRIVVDYEGLEDVILIAAINKNTGEELTLPQLHATRFPNVCDKEVVYSNPSSLEISELHIKKLKSDTIDNEEGWVIKFNNGFRMKIKFEEYLRLHRLITGVSSRTIWEYLKDKKSFDEILDNVPDEFYDWVRDTRNEILLDYHHLMWNVHKQLMQWYSEDRKEFAMRARGSMWPHILFSLYDQKDIEEMAWKAIRPEYQQPFTKEEAYEVEST